MPARTKTVASKPVNIHDKLLDALGEVDRPGDVCTSGDRPLVMPGLEVEGLGAVGLPLTKTQAKKLRPGQKERRSQCVPGGVVRIERSGPRPAVSFGGAAG